MANTEHIEAMLCAYVDGELDAAGRAEIEAHLQANPQHRQLLAELVEQRDMLRGLPRATAPEDLAESFQTQLERSVLFEKEDEPERYIAGRINRWPPIVAAAVLLLSVGLVTIIYFMLPAYEKRGDVALLSTTARTIDEADRFESTTALAAAPLPEASPAPLATEPPVAAKGGGPATPDAIALSDNIASQYRTQTELLPPSADKIAAASGAKNEADIFAKAPDGFASNMGTANNFFKQEPQNLDAEVAERLYGCPTVRDNSMLVLVAANNPTETNRKVTDYLVQNGIAWEPIAEPMPEPVELKKDDFLASKRPRHVDHERLSKGGALSEEKRKEVAQKQEVTTGIDTEAAQTETPLASRSAEGALQQSAPVEQSPAQQPATTGAGEQAIVQAQQQRQDLDHIQQLGGQRRAPGTEPQVIVARNLTRQQVADLATCVSRDNAYSVGQFNRARGGGATPATMNLAGVFTLADKDRALEVPGTQAKQLERALTENQSKVFAETATAAPSTQLAAGAAAAGAPPPPPLTPAPVPAEIAEQRLTTVGGGTTAPATQPPADAAVTTQPADEQIDVVIVLQPPAPLAPATATSPATTESTTQPQ